MKNITEANKKRILNVGLGQEIFPHCINEIFLKNRNDTIVLDEPFYAYHLKKTGLNHPGRDLVLKSQKHRWDEVVSLCLNELPLDKNIFYQKHMAHHFFDNKIWIG